MRKIYMKLQKQVEYLKQQDGFIDKIVKDQIEIGSSLNMNSSQANFSFQNSGNNLKTQIYQNKPKFEQQFYKPNNKKNSSRNQNSSKQSSHKSNNSFLNIKSSVRSNDSVSSNHNINSMLKSIKLQTNKKTSNEKNTSVEINQLNNNRSSINSVNSNESEQQKRLKNKFTFNFDDEKNTPNSNDNGNVNVNQPNETQQDSDAKVDKGYSVKIVDEDTNHETEPFKSVQNILAESKGTGGSSNSKLFSSENINITKINEIDVEFEGSIDLNDENQINKAKLIENNDKKNNINENNKNNNNLNDIVSNSKQSDQNFSFFKNEQLGEKHGDIIYEKIEEDNENENEDSNAKNDKQHSQNEEEHTLRKKSYQIDQKKQISHKRSTISSAFNSIKSDQRNLGSQLGSMLGSQVSAMGRQPLHTFSSRVSMRSMQSNHRKLALPTSMNTIGTNSVASSNNFATRNSSMAQENTPAESVIKQLIFEMNCQPGCVLMVDENQRILFQNDNISTTLLQDKHELIDIDLTSLVTSNDPIRSRNEMENLLSDWINNKISNDEIEDIKWTIIDKNNFTQTFTIKFNSMKQEGESGNMHTNVVIYMEPYSAKINKYNCSFDPRNIQYLLYSLLMALIIVFLMFQIPYDIAFGYENNQFNFYLDFFVTAVFTIDIILNFFAAFETKENEYEFDLLKIIPNYIKGLFILDVCSTIPFDQLFNWIVINTSIIKTIRIFKILKLVKILRVSKFVSFLSTKGDFLENELGKEFQIQIKSSSGFFVLVIHNMQIIAAAHFYTIFFYYVKNDLIEKGQHDWFIEQQNTQFDDHFNIYLFLISENVKTALCLSVSNPTSSVEILMNLLWIFVGISMFGQGIGNISSYLNNANQDELEQIGAINFFNELCENNNVDPRVSQMISNDLENQYNHINEKRFQTKGKMLSNTVMIQLESALQKDFVKEFQLFQKMQIHLIRNLKEKSTFCKGKPRMAKGSVINEVFLITQGKFTLYNNDMKFINEQVNDEIFGLDQFQNQLKLKYHIDMKVIGEVNKKGNYTKNNEYLQRVNSLKVQIREKLGNQAPVMGNTNSFQMPMFAEDNNIKMTMQYHPISSEDLTYYSIPFQVFEELLFIDPESFLQVYSYHFERNEPIEPADRVASNKSQHKFNSKSTAGLMLTLDGQVQDINMCLLREEFDFTPLIGLQLFDIITNGDKFKDVHQLDWGSEMILEIKTGKFVKMTVVEFEYMNIMRGVNQFDEEDEFNSNYYNLKKSMISLKTIYIDIEHNI